MRLRAFDDFGRSGRKHSAKPPQKKTPIKKLAIPAGALDLDRRIRIYDTVDQYHVTTLGKLLNQSTVHAEFPESSSYVDVVTFIEAYNNRHAYVRFKGGGKSFYYGRLDKNPPCNDTSQFQLMTRGHSQKFIGYEKLREIFIRKSEINELMGL